MDGGPAMRPVGRIGRGFYHDRGPRWSPVGHDAGLEAHDQQVTIRRPKRIQVMAKNSAVSDSYRGVMTKVTKISRLPPHRRLHTRFIYILLNIVINKEYLQNVDTLGSKI